MWDFLVLCCTTKSLIHFLFTGYFWWLYVTSTLLLLICFMMRRFCVVGLCLCTYARRTWASWMLIKWSQDHHKSCLLVWVNVKQHTHECLKHSVCECHWCFVELLLRYYIVKNIKYRHGVCMGHGAVVPAKMSWFAYFPLKLMKTIMSSEAWTLSVVKIK